MDQRPSPHRISLETRIIMVVMVLGFLAYAGLTIYGMIWL